jgi:hypothetical protein
MNIDWKAVITPLVTSAITILAAFNVVVPAEWIPWIVTVGVIIMNFLPSILKKKTQ